MAICKRYHSDEEYREIIRERARVWYHNNKKKALERMKKYNLDNKDQIREQNRRRYESKNDES